jgi:precorrin-6B C5,15-methyltransferase / cobalt-precorrin-6B C5,C15-methyltransferase
MGNPWLTIIGLGEDGGKALPDASRDALARAEFVFGGARHLDLVAGMTGQAHLHPWPIPFDTAPLLALAGRRVVALASGDPFWFGAGAVLAGALPAGAWVSHPAPSSFALAANRLGWALEHTLCHGLHAAPYPRLRPDLQNGARLLVTLRDGAAPAELAAYLAQIGFGASDLWVLSRLGGPLEQITQTRADTFDAADTAAPVMMAIHAQGQGLPRGFGLPDDLFGSDGQITKSPIRALTLSALAPRAGNRLWDIGAGSGSISVEWCLAGGLAEAIEARADRAANITANAAAFGVDHRLNLHIGAAQDILATLPPPDAVFVGGGGTMALFQALWPLLPAGCRVVANAVTLESESLLTQLCAQHGGGLIRVDIAHAAPLGRMTGWQAARPIVQYSVQR